jgi:hypothetical protein
LVDVKPEAAAKDMRRGDLPGRTGLTFRALLSDGVEHLELVRD